MCLLGDGNKLHKKAMEAFRKEEEREKRRSTVASNIFRMAIVDLKLGIAATHFKTMISFLSCCSVDVGNIRYVEIISTIFFPAWKSQVTKELICG
jgi:hypothetical protein